MLQAARKYRSDFMRTTEVIDEDEEKAENPTPDSRSLISVSPSEPGAASASTSSVVTSGEQSDSMGNLVDLLPRKHSRATPIRTVLSPTSSLPNLHPMDSPLFKFPTSVQEGDEETQGPRSKSLPSKAFDYVPAVSETTDGLGAVKLVKSSSSDGGSSSSLHNANNSNSHIPDYWPSLSNENFGYSTTGRIKQNKPAPGPTGMTPCASVDRIDVRRHQSMASSAPRRPVEMVTSLVAAPAAATSGKKGLHQMLMRRVADQPTETVKGQAGRSKASAPPRVRGRRERQGSSRYSYLQAVYDPAKYDS